MKKIFLIGIVILAMLTGCNANILDAPPEENSLEWGFSYNSGMPLPSDYCAYKSDVNEFDITDVTLTFYFGATYSGVLSGDYDEDFSIPEFDVYFGDSNYEPVYMIRHSDESFVSEEYRVTITGGENHTVKINYNHSETVTIPQELFSEQQGVIRFCVSGTIFIKEVEPKYELITIVLINYDIKDGKVILSPWDGYRD